MVTRQQVLDLRTTHDVASHDVASQDLAEVVTPALYRTRIGHTRHRPRRHAFRYRHPMWLVDVARLPRGVLLGRLLRFDARDHLGDPTSSIHENVVAFAAEHKVDVSDDRIVMLANARMFGYVFNPITVFWCLTSDGVHEVVTCVIAEVHNTYGGRHCYFLVPDETGTCECRQGPVRLTVQPRRRPLRHAVQQARRARTCRHRIASGGRARVQRKPFRSTASLRPSSRYFARLRATRSGPFG